MNLKTLVSWFFLTTCFVFGANAADISGLDVNSNEYSDVAETTTDSSALWDKTTKPTGDTGNIMFGGVYKKSGGRCAIKNRYTGSCSCPSGFVTTNIDLYNNDNIYFCSKQG